MKKDIYAATLNNSINPQLKGVIMQFVFYLFIVVVLGLLVGSCKGKTETPKDPSVPKPFTTTTVTVYTNPYLHPLSNPFKYNKPFTYKYFNYPPKNPLPKDTYLKNSITLNVIDRLQQKVVWSGTANADLYDTAYLRMNLHPVVYDILEQYPVKPYYKHRNKTKSINNF